jgi:hypothetical protein
MPAKTVMRCLSAGKKGSAAIKGSDKERQEPVLVMLPDTPNTRRLAQAMRVATIRYNLAEHTSKRSGE